MKRIVSWKFRLELGALIEKTLSICLVCNLWWASPKFLNGREWDFIWAAINANSLVEYFLQYCCREAIDGCPWYWFSLNWVNIGLNSSTSTSTCASKIEYELLFLSLVIQERTPLSFPPHLPNWNLFSTAALWWNRFQRFEGSHGHCDGHWD